MNKSLYSPFRKAKTWSISALFFGVALFLMAASCNRRAAISPPAPATQVRPAPQLVNRLNLQKGRADKIKNFEAKTNIYTEMDGQAITADARLVWYRDSALFIIVKKFGFEAVRALVTPDSAWVLNRLDKTVAVRSLAALQSDYGLPEDAGFSTLTEVLLGQFTSIEGLSLSSDIAEEQHRLKGSNGQILVDYRVEEGTFALRSETFLQQSKERAATLIFDRHQKINIGDILFPYFRRVETYSPETGKQILEVKFNDLQLNTQPHFRFEIPAHYDRI